MNKMNRILPVADWVTMGSLHLSGTLQVRSPAPAQLAAVCTLPAGPARGQPHLWVASAVSVVTRKAGAGGLTFEGACRTAAQTL